MVSYKDYNPNINEDFVMFLTPKLITCFIDCFISGMTSQSFAYLLIGSAHTHTYIYIHILDLDLEGEVHSIWDL